ncbi:MAG: ABC transporter permease [Methanobrevibacter sp.]|jgi:NitT/TauT family transport system permease protein|nr:ABC transporter permease [Candidatus Methanoflexus mossambicus]
MNFDMIKFKTLTKLTMLQIAMVFFVFIGLIFLTQFNPHPLQNPLGGLIYSVILSLLILLFLLMLLINKKPQKIADIFTVLIVLFIAWEIVTRFNLVDIVVLPPPGQVFEVYGEDYGDILFGVVSSLSVLLSGYGLAILIAIPLGLIVAYKKRLYEFVYPISKGFGPIPPMVYIPYAIVLLPSLFLSSVFVLFIGAFWPLLIGVISGVLNIDEKYVNSAKTLGLSDWTMIKKILLPAAMPHIFQGAFISLIISFITLLVAEVIGSSAGIGWYLQHNAQFARYDAIIAGMIVISIMVIVIATIFDKIQSHVLKWQKKAEF